MTQLQALAVLGIRLIAIWLLITTSASSIAYSASLFRTSVEPASVPGVAVLAAILAVSAAIGAAIPVVLLLYARGFARLLAPSDLPEIPGLNLGAEHLGRLAMSIIGVALIATSLPEIGGALVRYLASLNDPVGPMEIRMSTWPSLPEYLARAVTGAILFFAAFRIEPFLRPIMKVARPETPQTDETKQP